MHNHLCSVDTMKIILSLYDWLEFGVCHPDHLTKAWCHLALNQSSFFQPQLFQDIKIQILLNESQYFYRNHDAENHFAKVKTR